MLEAMHDTIARNYLDVEIVLEDMVLVLLSIRFYLRIVACCMVFIALIALAAYLQTLPSIFQTSDSLHAARLRTNSQTAYLHNGQLTHSHARMQKSTLPLRLHCLLPLRSLPSLSRGGSSKPVPQLSQPCAILCSKSPVSHARSFHSISRCNRIFL